MLPQPPPPGYGPQRATGAPTRPWITIYQPTRVGGRWIARADLRVGRELIELQASAGDSLVSQGTGYYDSLAQWLGDRVEYSQAPSRPLTAAGRGAVMSAPGVRGRRARGSIARVARFGQARPVLEAGYVSAQAPLALDPAGLSLSSSARRTIRPEMRLEASRGIFANLPVIAATVADSGAVPEDPDVTAATEKVKAAHEGDRESITEIAIIQEHAQGGVPEAIDALETIELADDAVSRPEEIDMPRVCAAAAQGDRCARKLLAALHAAGPSCQTRIEWEIEDYVQQSEAVLLRDVICAVTDQIEGRLATPWHARCACDRGQLLPASVQPAAFGRARRVRPSYERPMLDSFRAMLLAPGAVPPGIRERVYG